MKKRLFIAVMLCAAMSAGAQVPYEKHIQATYPGLVEKTIVRQYNNQNILGYVGTSAGNFFFWTDTTMQLLKNIELPIDYYVTDFEVYNNEHVYFCGYLAGGVLGNKGYMGYFNIYKAFNSMDCIYLALSFCTNAQMTCDIITHFHELEVYEKLGMQSGNISIVAVGETNRNGASYSCILEMCGQSGQPLSNWTYAVGTSSEKTETMTQITVTDSFVVTGGIIFDNQDAIKMRVFDKTSVPDIFTTLVPSPNGYDDVYYFPSNNVTNATAFPIDNNWQMTHLNGNDVVVASFWRDGYYSMIPLYYEGMLLHVYDIYNMITTPNISPSQTALDYYPRNIGVTRISDLRYNNIKNVLYLVLKTDNSQQSLRSKVFEFSPVTLYSPIFYYLPFIEIDHLDNFNNYDNNIGIGSPRWSNELILYAYPVGSNPMCSVQTTWTVYPTSEFTSKMHTYKLDIYRDNISFVPYWPATPEVWPVVKCP